MKKLTVLAVALVLGMFNSAFAVTPQSGIYVSALGGWSFASDPSAYSGASQTNQNYTWGASLGLDHAVASNFLLGAEVGYINFGKTTYNGNFGSNSFKNDGYQILATGTYLNRNGFNSFIKIGAIDQTTNMTENVDNYSASGDQTDVIPAMVLGIGYMPKQNFNISLQWEHTFGQSYNNVQAAHVSNPMTQDAVSLGLSFKFS